MKKPDRLPDYKILNWSFWFDEMIEFVEYGNNEPGKLIIEDGLFYYISDGSHIPIHGDIQKELILSYKKWLISKCLKDKINE